MPVSIRKSRTKASPCMRWSTQTLLPLPHESVRSLSLNAHLALEACRAQDGNLHMLNELTRLTYLSFYMWKAGIGKIDLEVYEAAEEALNRAVERAEGTGVWRLPESHIGALEQMLVAYNGQIATVSARTYIEAVFRLDRVLSQNAPQSPVAKMLAIERGKVCAAR